MEENQQAKNNSLKIFKVRGKVVSDKMEKTIVVEVIKTKYLPKYKKKIKIRKKYKAHDPNKECKTGDLVEIVPCRPMSAQKRWRLFKKIESPSQ